VFWAATDLTVATSEPSPSTRVNARVDGAVPASPTTENETWPASITTPSAMRNTADGSSQGPQAAPVNVLPRVFNT